VRETKPTGVDHSSLTGTADSGKMEGRGRGEGGEREGRGGEEKDDEERVEIDSHTGVDAKPMPSDNLPSAVRAGRN
jgi:hypothetical protein